MARKHKHEEHQNHEAWAIPYGDLITLLLAFFVVMYAISSVNEGKFRVLSDSLQAAFRGSPKTLDPVQVGEKSPRGNGADIAASMAQQGKPRQMLEALTVSETEGKGLGPKPRSGDSKQIEVIVPPELAKVADDVEASLAALVDAQLVTVQPPFVLDRSRNPRGHPVPERRRDDLPLGRTRRCNALAKNAGAVPEPHPRRRPHRQQADQDASCSRPTGNCLRPAPRAWSIYSPMAASRPIACPSSVSANGGPPGRTTRPTIAMPIAACCWSSSRAPPIPPTAARRSRCPTIDSTEPAQQRAVPR